MSRDHDETTEAELAKWQYAHREELDGEEGEPVEASISPQLSVTMSFRLPGTEADAIREAAHAADMSLSEWIRQILACAAASARQDDANWGRDVEAQLTEAEQRLDATAEALQDIKRRVRAGMKSHSAQKTGKTASTTGTAKKSPKQSRPESGAKKATSGSKARKKAAGKKASGKGDPKRRADG